MIVVSPRSKQKLKQIAMCDCHQLAKEQFEEEKLAHASNLQSEKRALESQARATDRAAKQASEALEKERRQLQEDKEHILNVSSNMSFSQANAKEGLATQQKQLAE